MHFVTSKAIWNETSKYIFFNYVPDNHTNCLPSNSLYTMSTGRKKLTSVHSELPGTNLEYCYEISYSESIPRPPPIS